MRPDKHSSQRQSKITLVILAVVCLLGVTPASETRLPSGTEAKRPESAESLAEQRVKSAFIYNFVKFATWPKNAFDKQDDPIRIGVVGDTRIVKPLAATLKDKVVGGRKLEVVIVSDIAKLPPIQVLYIGSDLKGKVEADLLGKLRKEPTLTVGDVEGFAKRGGVINFFIENKKIRFEINTNALKRSGVSLSSQLLKLARIIKE